MEHIFVLSSQVDWSSTQPPRLLQQYWEILPEGKKVQRCPNPWARAMQPYPPLPPQIPVALGRAFITGFPLLLMIQNVVVVCQGVVILKFEVSAQLL